MTTRVFECQRVFIPPPALTSRTSSARAEPGIKLTPAVLLGLLVVPFAGAAEPPFGWLFAAAAALTVLYLAATLGPRLPWGWLFVLVSTAGVVTPRGQVQVVGPGLFTAAGVCLVLWLTNRDATRRRPGRSAEVGPRERAAQLMMGLSGERQVGRLLASDLPQDYVLINGLKLPRGAGDIDHLVVGPSGVFLLETKTMAGRIVCQPDGTWRRTRVGRAGTEYAAFIGDPAAQVRRNIFAARECLRNRLPHLFLDSPLWIEGLVVFPHPRTELQTEHSRIPAVLLEQAVPRICGHAPRRWLQTADVDAVVGTLLDEARQQHVQPVRQTAQALVELALMLPVVLALVFGTIAVSRVVQAQNAVVAVAHEAARAGALARDSHEAVDRIRDRAALVAPGLGLDPRSLVVESDVTRFEADPGEVLAVAHYTIEFGDLPLGNWAPSVALRASHVEWVDPFRSGIAPPPTAPD